MIVDAYSGPRGWSQGLRSLGLTDIGIDIDDAACRTAIAAGHQTIRADVATYPLDQLAGRVDGLILSPPCQAFSAAGNGEGRQVIDELCHAVRAGDWHWSHDDDRVRHVLEVGRWAETLRPTWIACEQVPPVLSVWQAYQARWRVLGWSAWAGILNAADYGVPQTRRRAFLIARTDGQPIGPPPATHCRGGAATLFGRLEPWVSMADALGWGATERPYVTLASGRTSGGPCYDLTGGSAARAAMHAERERGTWHLNPGRTETQPNRRSYGPDEPAPTMAFGHDSANWAWELPATTVAGDPRITARCHHDEGTQGADATPIEDVAAGRYDGTSPIRLTIRDALILQGFPPDYPVQGTRTKQFEQIGNAVPPPLAAAVLAAVTCRQTEAAA